jgi:phage terminase small subunit
MNNKFKDLKEKLIIYGYNDIDDDMLQIYVDNLEICEKMKHELERNGYFVVDEKKKTRVPSPAWQIYKQSNATIIALAKQMGITAFGRKTSGQQASEDMSIDEILGI